MQGDAAFLRDIQDAILEDLGYLIHEDGFEPIDPGHYAALFEMLLPSIMYTEFTSFRSSRK
jgi:hypothetical protein